MSLPILYSFRRCPYAIRARMAIVTSGFVCEVREVNLADKPDAMIVASPKATIPVMVLPNGRVVDESLDIMTHSLATRDPENWLSGVTADTMALVTTNDDVFKLHLDHYKYPDTYKSDAMAARDAGLAFLMGLNKRLSSQPWLVGGTCSVIDIAIFPFIRQFAAVNEAWFADQPIPHLQTWLTTLLSCKAFEAAMVTLPIWRPGDIVTQFPTIPTEN